MKKIILLMVCLFAITAAGFISMGLFKPTATPTAPEEEAATTSTPTPMGELSSRAAILMEDDLEQVYYFLMNNVGKEVKLAGEKHVITGKEEIDIMIELESCCKAKDLFDYAVNSVSELGEVRDAKFEELLVYAGLPVEKIPELATLPINKIGFEPESRKYWTQVLG